MTAKKLPSHYTDEIRGIEGRFGLSTMPDRAPTASVHNHLF